MHTPGHAVINLALIGQWVPYHPLALPILAGAVLPDVPIVVLYVREHYLRGLPDERIWSESYQQPFWLGLIHGAHSIPLATAGLVLSLIPGAHALAAFFASALLHSLLDLPVHVHDAHRHFLPFSQYRFISSLSYWDKRYHARSVALVEVGLVLGAAAWLWASASSWARGALAAVCGWYVVQYARNFLR